MLTPTILPSHCPARVSGGAQLPQFLHGTEGYPSAANPNNPERATLRRHPPENADANANAERNSPRFDPSLTLGLAHARISQMLRHDPRQDMFGVVEAEQGGHVEISREEVGVRELAGGRHALRVIVSS